MSLYSAAIEHYNRQTDEENYNYYIEKLSRLNKQIGGIIERENRQLNRKKEKKKKHAIIDKTDELTINPLTGKPISNNRKSAGVAGVTGEPGSAGVRRANTMLAPPQLSMLERKRMKNVLQMTLATKA